MCSFEEALQNNMEPLTGIRKSAYLRVSSIFFESGDVICPKRACLGARPARIAALLARAGAMIFELFAF